MGLALDRGWIVPPPDSAVPAWKTKREIQFKLAGLTARGTVRKVVSRHELARLPRDEYHRRYMRQYRAELKSAGLTCRGTPRKVVRKNLR